ncbi:unnamed protein product, partial [Iphiclides podalirius]
MFTSAWPNVSAARLCEPLARPNEPAGVRGLMSGSRDAEWAPAASRRLAPLARFESAMTCVQLGLECPMTFDCAHLGVNEQFPYRWESARRPAWEVALISSDTVDVPPV